MMFQGVPFNNARTWPMNRLPPGALGTLPRPLSMLIVRHKPFKQCNSSNPAKQATPNASIPPVNSTPAILAILFISEPALSGKLVVLESGSAPHWAQPASNRQTFFSARLR